MCVCVFFFSNPVNTLLSLLNRHYNKLSRSNARLKRGRNYTDSILLRPIGLSVRQMVRILPSRGEEVYRNARLAGENIYLFIF